MTTTRGSLSDQIESRQPIEVGGASGNTLERVTLRDGRELILKRVSPEWDWLSRATGDDGRACAMWDRGLFDRIPAAIEHSVVGVERDGSSWQVFMRDVSAALVADGRRLDRAEVRRVLAATAEFHLEFWGERFPALCGLEDRYRLLAPRTAQRELRLGNDGVGNLINKSWDAFTEHTPSDLAGIIIALADEPGPLAEQLDKCEQTLIHGDVRLSNLGFADDRLVLVDWGERTGTAPAAVELASFLVFDAKYFDVPREQVIEDFRGLYGDRIDERAFQLSMLGGMVQLGCNLGLGLVTAADDDARAAALRELAWWVANTETALETWSPR